jgi:hypothetical protein
MANAALLPPPGNVREHLGTTRCLDRNGMGHLDSPLAATRLLRGQPWQRKDVIVKHPGACLAIPVVQAVAL